MGTARKFRKWLMEPKKPPRKSRMSRFEREYKSGGKKYRQKSLNYFLLVILIVVVLLLFL